MLQALIFDSYYDKHRGVIAYVRVFNGSIKSQDQLHYIATGAKGVTQEVGFFRPHMEASQSISQGEVGYIITGLKSLDEVKVGDTISNTSDQNNALPGYKEVTPMVYASLFPIDADDYPKLKDSIAKLKANDAALVYETENIPAIGYGFRCGFLGLLHMDIVQERITREYGIDLILTTPSVQYSVTTTKGEEVIVHTPSELPDPSQIETIQEPWVNIEVLTPEEYVGKVIEIITDRRGHYKELKLVSGGQLQVMGSIPLSEMIVDFYDSLKSDTKGYATLSYELEGYKVDDLVKVDILVNHKIVDPLSFITHKSQAEGKGRHVCDKLKELIPRQQFEIAVQAAIGSRIIARETIKAFRKDVTAKLYGGDITRRKKLLAKQAKGKKRMKMVGNVEIPQSAFLNVLKK